jgi:hypothetical protein
MKAARLPAIGAGILLMASGLLASESWATASAAPSGRAPMQPASPVHLGQPGHHTEGSNATQSSLNWAGYAVTGAVFSDASGSWKQPTASCPHGQAQQAAFWVGIDGLSASDPTVEQIGTDSDCAKGRGRRGGGPTYYAWFQMFPRSVVVLPVSTYPVAPGDSITASVSVSGSVYTLAIVDNSKWFFATNQSASAQNSSAEWIAEAPSTCTGRRCKSVPLTDFGSMAFTSASANHQVISAPGFTDYQITMVTKGSKIVRAQPSGLAFGGSVFAVTWMHS